MENLQIQNTNAIDIKEGSLKKASLGWNLNSIFSFSYFLVFLTFLILGCFQNKKGKESRLTKVIREDVLQKITISGHIEPKMKTRVVSPYEGYIQKLFVQVGQNVKSGDRLVLVSPTLSETENLYPLRAPYKGTVVRVVSRAGESVKRGGLILRVDDLSSLFVFSSVPEINVLKIKKNQEVLIQSVAVLGKKYKGIVKEISLSNNAPEVQRLDSNRSINYDVKIDILNEDQFLKSGMSTVVDIVTAQKQGALVLPHEFINKKGEKYFVTLKNGEKKEVQIGIASDLWIEVLNLSEGLEVQQIDFYEN